MDRQKKNSDLIRDRLLKRGRLLLDKISADTLKTVFFTALSFCISYFFGKTSLMFDTYPLGFAFFAASGGNLIASFAGLILSALVEGSNAALYISGYFITAAARYAASFLTDKKHFSANRVTDTLLHKITSCLCGVFTVSVIRIISGGFVYYDLLGAVFFMASSALMTFMYAFVVSGGAARRQGAFEAGVCALVFSSVLALRGIDILGFSLPIVFSFFATLYISCRGGAMRGGVTGFLCGAALDITVSPAFALIGFTAGAVFPFANRLSCILSVGAGFLCLYYTVGFTELFAYVPEALLAAVLFLFLLQLQKKRGELSFPEAAPVFSAGAFAAAPFVSVLPREEREQGAKERIQDISASMETMAEVFFALSQKQRTPTLNETLAICENEYAKYCRKCNLCAICRKKEALSTSDAIMEVAEKIYKEGRISSEEVPPYLKSRCFFTEKIIRQINDSIVSFVSGRIKADKIEVVAFDYAQMSRLLRSTVQQNEIDFKIDEKATAEIKKNMIYSDFFANNILVYGARKKRIVAGGVDVARIKYNSAEIRKSFEAILSLRFSEPEFKIDRQYVTMTLGQIPRIRCRYGKSTFAKDGENANGDIAALFSGAEDYSYSLICDGMGSGKEASVTSRLCGVFLQKMLTAKCRKTDTVEMLNHFLRQKGAECFATLDLLEIDTLNGKASFLKCGACPSYIVRDGRIFKIFSKTPPVGIMKQYSGEEIAFDLKSGDMIVMMSDGVFDAEESEVWLYNLLTYEMESSPTALCAKIMEKAQAITTGNDDMTVSAIRIEGA